MIRSKLPPLEKKDFAHICKIIRESVRYTQTEMGNILGVTALTYANWEKGNTTPDGNSAIWLHEVYKELQQELQMEK